MTVGDFMPLKAGIDEGNNKAYLEFEASKQVQDCLKWYYDDQQIGRFIRNYATCRKLMQEAREVIENRE